MMGLMVVMMVVGDDGVDGGDDGVDGGGDGGW